MERKLDKEYMDVTQIEENKHGFNSSGLQCQAKIVSLIVIQNAEKSYAT